MEVGRVRRAHGIRGALLIEPLSDVPERFDPGSELVAVTRTGERRVVVIVSAAPHGDTLLTRLEGYESREDVEALRGATLEVSRDLTPSPPEGSFYYFELIGCACSDRSAGPLGTVREVIEDGGGLLLEVSDGTRSLLVPFVRSYIRSIDVGPSGRIELDLPEGLIDTCVST